jgi:O-antigen/teichoic acid export membrane protein
MIKSLNKFNWFIKDILGLNTAIIFVLGSRAWMACSGLISIYMVARYLSPELQGFYYTFLSLIALQVFFELGLSFVITQVASHEMAHLSKSFNGLIIGPPLNKARLASLMKFIFKWNVSAACLLSMILIPSGLYFFKNQALTYGNALEINYCWIILVLFTSLNILLSVILAFIEGCGEVVGVAKIKLLQFVPANIIFWLTLIAGYGFISVSLIPLISSIIGLFLIILKYGSFIGSLLKESTHNYHISWKKEIWPFQWKIAVSWLSGYLSFQIFNPLLFKYHGPLLAGQVGMSLQLIFGLNGLAIIWITTKLPHFGNLVAKKEFDTLGLEFEKAFNQSLLFISSLIILTFISYLWVYGNFDYIKNRVIEPKYFIFLLFVCLLNHIIFSKAAFLRVFKKEPFMFMSLASGALTFLIAILTIPQLGVIGVLISYLTSSLFIGFFFGNYLFKKNKKEFMSE